MEKSHMENHLSGIKSLIEDFVKRNQPILFYNLKPSVVEVFQGVQPKEFKHCHNEAELNELLKEYAKKLSQRNSIQINEINGRQL
uniref:Uncharacterized protein n=1 Tax=Timema tahoe TaxID=61484 RepID=A0A7R9ITX5_9NEOP|nr:unnamed protein product [Timema tahoe]